MSVKKHLGSAAHRRLTVGGATALALAGLTSIGFGLYGNPPPPQPPTSLTTPTAPTHTSPVQATPEPTAPPVTHPAVPAGLVLPASTPTTLVIPAIGVDTNLIQLGQNPDGTVQVPPMVLHSPAGWYDHSPTPGQLGPSVILGHVDTYSQRSVFYRLGDMRPGDEISVTREDHTVAVFHVTQVGDYPKADFPQLQVYGNTPTAQLRLITCGGSYDAATGHYLNNIVIYATLTTTHPA